jgi:hypothetical protein
MKIEINEGSLDIFKKGLAQSLQDACEYGAMQLQDFTPIDTKRLFSTTRTEKPVIRTNSITCEIVAGGVRAMGILREQGIERDVDYAIFIETREGYITNNIGAIAKEIKDNL